MRKTNKIKKIKIAIVAPPFGDTGGPEIAVQSLVDSLIDKGINVTFFTPADWKTKAKHISTLKQSLWNMKDFKKQTGKVRINLIILSQMEVVNCQNNFDIIHLHSSAYAYAVAKLLKKPCILSLHNRIGSSEFAQIKKAGVYTVSLSNSQKGKLKTAKTIWNGVQIKNIKFSRKKGSYLITAGRITDQKGIDTAIKIAKKAGKKLLIFGRIGNSPERQRYLNQRIKPFLDNKQIIYKGEVSNRKILGYLKNAEALIFPIKRPEVCPMIIAESLACGTPVIGTKIDPLPELLGNNKKIAFLSNSSSKLIEAAKNTDRFNRLECRKYAEKYFDSSIIADKYINLYEKIINKWKRKK